MRICVRVKGQAMHLSLPLPTVKVYGKPWFVTSNYIRYCSFKTQTSEHTQTKMRADVPILLLLTLGTSVNTAPFLQQIADWFSKIKYVPPQEAISLSSHIETTPTTTTKPSGVFFKDGGWLQSWSTEYSYLLGDQSMSWADARDWCKGKDGYLAEVIGSGDQAALANLLGEHNTAGTNFWVGLRQPYFRWDRTKQLVAWGNWKTSDSIPEKRSCTGINGSSFKWENHDCTFNHGYRPLCQKNINASIKEVKVEDEKHCVLEGVAVALTYWLGRHQNVKFTADCHALCLKNKFCRFWTLDKLNHLCYLKEEDSFVKVKSNFDSGTTLRSKGCNRPLNHHKKESRIETCSCANQKLEVLSDGYLDPRSLPQKTSDYSETENSLGRLLSKSACPHGKTLVCTDDHDFLILESKNPVHHISNEYKKPNITDCIVYDVRLAAGKAINTLYNVANSETCHVHCLTTAGCHYWTWRGELNTKVCFLLEKETRMVRRAGSTAGTVLPKYGCNSKLVRTEDEYNNSDDNDCACKRDNEDWISHLGARAGPIGTGRIVNLPSEDRTLCPLGYSRVCPGDNEFEALPLDAYEDWDYAPSSDFSRESLYGRTVENSNRSPRVLENGSGVNFPNV